MINRNQVLNQPNKNHQPKPAQTKHNQFNYYNGNQATAKYSSQKDQILLQRCSESAGKIYDAFKSFVYSAEGTRLEPFKKEQFIKEMPEFYYNLCNTLQSDYNIPIPKEMTSSGLSLDHMHDNLNKLSTVIAKEFGKVEDNIKLGKQFVNRINNSNLSQLLEKNWSTQNLTPIEQTKLKAFCNDLQKNARLANGNSANMAALGELAKGNQHLIDAILSNKTLNQFIGVAQNSNMYSCSVLSTLMKASQLNEKAINVTRNPIQETVTLNMPSSKFSISRLNRDAFLNTIKGYGISVTLDKNSCVTGITIPEHLLTSFDGSSSKSEVMIPNAAVKGLEIFFALYKTFGNNLTTTSPKKLKPISQVVDIYKERFIHNGYNIYNIADLLGCELSYHPFKNIKSINYGNHHKYMLLYNTNATARTNSKEVVDGTNLHYAKFDYIDNRGKGEIVINPMSDSYSQWSKYYTEVDNLDKKYTLMSMKKR